MLCLADNIYEGPVLKALTQRRISGTFSGENHTRGVGVSRDGRGDPFCAAQTAPRQPCVELWAALGCVILVNSLCNLLQPYRHPLWPLFYRMKY